MIDEKNMTCAFCGKSLVDADTFAAQGIDENIFICEDCITDLKMSMENANSYFREENDKQEIEASIEEPQMAKLPHPSEIKAHLDQYIVGQDYAKKVLSVAVYNHYKMLAYKFGAKKSDVELEKSNIMLVGPSGCGKTAVIRALAKFLKVPFVIADATSYTSAGYVGKDVESMVKMLYDASGGDIKATERGIIYIDEIDKISRKGENLSTTADPGHEGTQQALLKLLEGNEVDIPMDGRRINPESNNTQSVNTENILFIVGGAFEGIEKIIGKRLRSGNSSIGIGATIADKKNDKYNDFIEKVATEDLKKFGMLPEILGRIPVIAPLKELDEEALVTILTQPKNALIKQYKELLNYDDAKLEVTKAALIAIAKKAMARKTGARGLRGIIEEILNPIMFSIPDKDEKHVIIDAKNDDITVDYKKSTKKKKEAV